MRIRYRARQLWHALTATPDPGDLEQARRVLSPAQMELFLKLQPNEQVHSLRIYRQLFEQDPLDEDLQVAALLHDVGKAPFHLRPWERVWIVIAKAILPAQIAKWGQGEPRGWKRPFVIAEQHPAWGAEMAARAGTTQTAVNLIRRHQQPIALQDLQGGAAAAKEDRLLYRLQRLDNES